MLYIVPTPVGNLEDMTYRAVRILGEVDAILAEDTRTTAVLLDHFGIKNKVQAYHKFNEHKAVDRLIADLQAGHTFALVSDAGTPGISDPGFLIARACVEAGVGVQCLPGATAFVPALVASGIPCDRFAFEGFLPQKKGRQTRLQELADESRTIVFYESPHRLLKTLAQFAEVFGGDRKACVAREISKLYEEIVTDTLENLIMRFLEQGVKGEFVIIVGATEKKAVKSQKNKYKNTDSMESEQS